VLTPDAEQQYGRSGRSPQTWLRNIRDDVAGAFAEELNEVADNHVPGEAKPDKLPISPNVRLGLNVAQCDRQPLAIVWSPDAARREALAAQASALAWSPEHRGRFAWAVAETADDLKAIPGAAEREGIIVVQPDEFGLKGTVLASGENPLQEGLALAKFQHGVHDRHLANAVRLGIRWKSATPIEDKGTIGAIQRLWGGG
jgi:hypothetical protein